MLALRRVLMLVCLLGAQATFALSFDESRHLLYRAGFGPETVFLDALDDLNRKQAVRLLMDQVDIQSPPPACVDRPIVGQAVRSGWNDEQRRMGNKARRQCGAELKAWYAAELLDTNAVLKAQMTLFWHNHFTSSRDKVKEAKLLYNQHQLLSEHALGRFDQMLLSIVQDPAMLIYLDNTRNKKGKPNENLARELLELFSLGEGRYTEQDIKALARALTGLHVDRESYKTVFKPRQHDSGQKTLFGETSGFDAEGAVGIILKQPDTARFIARKLWLHFVSKPDDAEIERLALGFEKGWDIRQLVSGILLSSAFWSDSGQMIKSPAELVVGSVRLFNARMVSPRQITKLMARMGQDLFDPPNVKGWPTAEEWIDTDRMLARIRFGERLSRGLVEEYSMAEQIELCTGELPQSFAAMGDSERAVGECGDRLADLLVSPVWQLK